MFNSFSQTWKMTKRLANLEMGDVASPHNIQMVTVVFVSDVFTCAKKIESVMDRWGRKLKKM